MACELCDGGPYGFSDGTGGHSSDCPSLVISNAIKDAGNEIAEAIANKEVDLNEE